MAGNIDPLILELRAELGKYRADLKSTTALVESNLKRQENSAQRLEAQMRKSSGAISGSLKSIATGLAGAFGAREIVGLIDNFTRLQNSLRVSGLEGQKLADVQASLLDLSSKYGVSVNDLADLYGKSSQAAGDLGASTAQLLQITEASAQSLKITGTSAAQAQGALLGLTQALSSGRVKAEEFNQINEGGLRPLLQAAANTEKYGGSVAKLRAAVVDGKLSSQEFYQAILNGSAELEAKAAKATLTLAGAFAALASNLTVYVGEASAANGVTGGLAAGIGLLADNLDKIIPALAIIATGLGVGVVANAVAARVATDTLGKSMLAAFGGTIGIAITAIAVAMGLLVSESVALKNAIAGAEAKLTDAQSRFETYAQAARDSGVAVDQSGDAATTAGNKFNALGGIIGQAINLYKDLAANARIAAIVVAQSNIATAQSEARKSARKLIQTSVNPLASFLPGFGKEENNLNIQKQNALIAQEKASIALLSRLPDGAIKSATTRSSVASDEKEKKTKETKGPNPPKDRSEEIALRTESQLRQLDQEVLQAKAQLATNATERADFEKKMLDVEREQRLSDLAANKALSADERAAQKAFIDELFGVSDELSKDGEIIARGRPGLIAQQINRETEARLSEEAARIAEVVNRNAIDALEYQYDMATSNKERLRLALAIVDAETANALAANDEALLRADISKEKRKELLAIRAGIIAAGERGKVNATQGNQGAIGTYRDELKKMNFGDKAEEYGVEALKDLNDGLADAIVNGGNLGDVLEDTGKRFIKQLIAMALQLLIIKPLMESLSSIGTAGGPTGIFSAIGQAFGAKPRASGGPVSGGSFYRVNESQQEFFKPDVNGKILTMSQMKNAVGGGGGSQPVIIKVYAEEGSMFVPRIEQISGNVSVQVVQAAAPSIVDASANEALRRGGRPRL